MIADYEAVTKVRWSSLDPSQRFPIHNPATGAIITHLCASSAQEVDGAVQAAEVAYQTIWRWLPSSARSAYLFKCGDALEPRKEELAELLCIENGKPKVDALEFDINFLRGPINTTVIYEPFGVCAGILSFNWPPIHFGGKVAPALAAGNVMIIKPGEQTPLPVLRICEIISEVLPRDVVQVMPGLGPEVPQALINHELVKMVSFTGSNVSGSKVAEAAAKTITPVVLELGGKNAFVVFDDVESIDSAVSTALEGAFFNKGEAYSCFENISAEGSVSKAQQEKVLGYLEKAKQSKATFAAQGQVTADPAYKNGFFVPATLITDVTRDMSIAQEDMFGALVTVTPFETEEEAIDIVNESKYGLTSIIFSSNQERCWRYSKKVDVGMVWVNNYFRNVLGTLFGEAKESGYGREHCMETLREWSRAKTVNQPSGFGEIPSWRAVKDIFG
ncbi:putative Aldehyde dehydrogenase domain-containing protein [Seiridium cardinale]|uniref:aldehyde dehydrogenase (NAD(+)) n=1 Tax=Seiridium cardinale TaxID=138064 RepID=A0ABR2X6Z5_9PEZI